MTDTAAHLANDTRDDTALCGVSEWRYAFVLIEQSPLEMRAPADSSGWCNVCVGRWIVAQFDAGRPLQPNAERSLRAFRQGLAESGILDDRARDQ